MSRFFRKLNVFLVLIYVLGWVTGMAFSSVLFVFWLMIPMVSLLIILCFGCGLTPVQDSVFRIVAFVLLLIATCYSVYSVFYAGEQGAVGLIFVGVPTVALCLLLYTIFVLINQIRKR
ncbi:MAG: hypothetical protein KTR18_06755 [Acidiferrobacterales bacterium]|nr:hypothetical protein [Acidiferrobacterales bacterium]